MVKIKFVPMNKNINPPDGTSTSNATKTISKKPLPPKGAYKIWYDENYTENFRAAQMLRKTKDNWDTYFSKRCKKLYEQLPADTRAGYKKLSEKDMTRFLKEHKEYEKIYGKDGETDDKGAKKVDIKK